MGSMNIAVAMFLINNESILYQHLFGAHVDTFPEKLSVSTLPGAGSCGG